MALSWLINGGDPNHLEVLGWSSKYKLSDVVNQAIHPSNPSHEKSTLKVCVRCISLLEKEVFYCYVRSKDCSRHGFQVVSIALATGKRPPLRLRPVVPPLLPPSSPGILGDLQGKVSKILPRFNSSPLKSYQNPIGMIDFQSLHLKLQGVAPKPEWPRRWSLNFFLPRSTYSSWFLDEGRSVPFRIFVKTNESPKKN